VGVGPFAQFRLPEACMSFKRRYFASVLFIVLLAVFTARADDFWVKKDWKQWSKDECNKMLTDSPWSKTWSKSQVNLSAALPGSSGANQEGASGNNSSEIHYSIQFRSALPVREAYVRLQQIGNKYDKMSDAQKKSFDAQADSILGKTYDDVILVHVEYGSNVTPFERQMATYWKSIRPDSVPEDFYLINERGDRVAPVKFLSPPGGVYAFELIFPRLKDNEPFVRDADKNLSLQFLNPAVGIQSAVDPGANSQNDAAVGTFGRERVLAQYKVDKMMLNGKLLY
jgi:hypothetical protein